MGRFLFIIWVVFFLPMTSGAMENIPLAAGICVNKANLLIEQDKIDQAVSILEEFSGKQNIAVPKKPDQKGYSHYYIDYLLGNTYIMLDQKEKIGLDGKTGQKGKTGLKKKIGPKGKSLSHIKKAAAALTRAVEKKPDLFPAWLNLAKCRYELGDMKEAARAFLKAYETCENKKPATLYQASLCYSLAQDYNEALSIFNTLVADHPGEIKLAWKEALVNILHSLEKYHQALPWIEELAQKSKKESRKNWQEILVYQYLNLKMQKKALEYVRFLTKTDPCEATWWKTLTHIHLGENQLEKALNAFLIYSFISPLSLKEISFMADLYISCGIPLKAAMYYNTYLDKEKDPKKIQDKISRISHAYLAGGQGASALEWIEKGLALKTDPELLQMKALALDLMQDPEQDLVQSKKVGTTIE
jgi:tetratricopeptide (TPR) repeat protein